MSVQRLYTDNRSPRSGAMECMNGGQVAIVPSPLCRLRRILSELVIHNVGPAGKQRATDCRTPWPPVPVVVVPESACPMNGSRIHFVRMQIYCHGSAFRAIRVA